MERKDQGVFKELSPQRPELQISKWVLVFVVPSVSPSSDIPGNGITSGAVLQGVSGYCCWCSGPPCGPLKGGLRYKAPTR